MNGGWGGSGLGEVLTREGFLGLIWDLENCGCDLDLYPKGKYLKQRL